MAKKLRGRRMRRIYKRRINRILKPILESKKRYDAERQRRGY